MTLLQAIILLAGAAAAGLALDLERVIWNRIIISVFACCLLILSGDDFARYLELETIDPANRDMIRTIVFAMILAAFVSKVVTAYMHAGKTIDSRVPKPRPLWKGVRDDAT